MKIRAAQASDMPAVWALIKELAEFEREPDAVIISPADLVRDGFGKQPLFRCWVAELDERIVGMALSYPRYSTWKGPTLHLEDLVVAQAYRGRGVGSALFEVVMQAASDTGVKRVEWAVLNWNEPAIAFYEKAGAKVFSDWRVVQMNEEQLAAFVQR